MDFKQQFVNKALGLMQDPRVLKFAQDPRVVSGVMNAMRMQSEVRRNLDQGVRRLAKTLNLASQTEVNELKRAVARLERELERARAARGAGDRAAGRPNA